MRSDRGIHRTSGILHQQGNRRLDLADWSAVSQFSVSTERGRHAELLVKLASWSDGTAARGNEGWRRVRIGFAGSSRAACGGGREIRVDSRRVQWALVR